MSKKPQALPDDVRHYNGSATPCDARVGPCCCGATHYESDWLVSSNGLIVGCVCHPASSSAGRQIGSKENKVRVEYPFRNVEYLIKIIDRGEILSWIDRQRIVAALKMAEVSPKDLSIWAGTGLHQVYLAARKEYDAAWDRKPNLLSPETPTPVEGDTMAHEDATARPLFEGLPDLTHNVPAQSETHYVPPRPIPDVKHRVKHFFPKSEIEKLKPGEEATTTCGRRAPIHTVFNEPTDHICALCTVQILQDLVPHTRHLVPAACADALDGTPIIANCGKAHKIDRSPIEPTDHICAVCLSSSICHVIR